MNGLHCKNCLSFLPTSDSLKTDFPAVIKKATRNLESGECQEFQRQIGTLVYLKCIHPIAKKRWDEKKYIRFRKVTSLLDDIHMPLLQTAFIRCLTASEEEILENLNLVLSHQDFSFNSERKYNPVTSSYETVSKEIESMDCYTLISAILSSMMQNLHRTAMKLLESQEDFNILYESISTIAEEGPVDSQRAILKDFDEQFSYLKETTLYASIYENYREKYFTSLLKNLLQEFKKQQRMQYYQKNRDYFCYHKQSFLENFDHSKRDNYGGAFKVYKKRGKNRI